MADLSTPLLQEIARLRETLTLPTRIYFPSGTFAADVTVTPDAAWGSTAGAALRKAVTDGRKRGSAAASITITGTAANPEQMLHAQYISKPLCAQTISGNVSGQFRALESATGANATIQIGIRVVSQDGATVRATLLAVGGTTTTSSTPPEFASSLTNRRLLTSGNVTPLPLSSYTCIDGDRLVIEVGHNNKSVSTSQTHQISFGDNTIDLLTDDADTAARDPWIEFDSPLAFSDLVEVLHLSDTGLGRTELIQPGGLHLADGPVTAVLTSGGDLVRNLSDAEALHVVDALTVTRDLTATLPTELLHGVDTVTAGGVLQATAGPESGHLTESAAGRLDPLVMATAPAESGHLVDGPVIGQIVLQANLQEVLHLTETQGRTALLGVIHVVDGPPQVAFGAAGDLTLNLGNAESLRLSESVQARRTLEASLTEALGLRERIWHAASAVSRGLDANPLLPTIDDFTQATRRAGFRNGSAMGVDFLTYVQTWAQVETSAGVYAWTPLTWLLDEHPGPVSIVLTVVNYDGTRTLPSYLGAAAFDDAGVISAYLALLDSLAATIGDRVLSLSVGQEINSYFGSHPTEIAAFATLCAAIRTKVTTLWPDRPTTVSFTSAAASSVPTTYSAVLAAISVPAITYYFINPDYSIRDANAGTANATVDADLFAIATALGGSQPFLLSELGCPSDASLGSSEALQAQVLGHLVAACQVYRDLRLLTLATINWQYDLDTWLLDSLGLTGPARAFTGSLGLRRTDGTPKPAWTTYRDALQVGAQAQTTLNPVQAGPAEALRLAETLTARLNPEQATPAELLHLTDQTPLGSLGNNAYLNDENLRLSETVSGRLNPEQAGPSETLHLADPIQAQLISGDLLLTPEGLHLTDAVSSQLANLSVTVTEILRLADISSVLSLLLQAAAGPETLRISDRVVILDVTLNESLRLTETGRGATQLLGTIRISDDVQAQVGLLLSVGLTETWHLADPAGAERSPFDLLLTETVRLAYTGSEVEYTQDESLRVADVVQPDLIAPTDRSVAITEETLRLAEAQTVRRDLAAALLTEPVTPTDLVTASRGLETTMSESGGLAEAVTGARDLTVLLTDSVILADLSLRELDPLEAHADDTILLLEQVFADVGNPLDLTVAVPAEDGRLADTIAAQSDLVIDLSEDLRLGDGLDAGFGEALAAAPSDESLRLADSLGGGVTPLQAGLEQEDFEIGDPLEVVTALTAVVFREVLQVHESDLIRGLDLSTNTGDEFPPIIPGAHWQIHVRACVRRIHIRPDPDRRRVY